MENPMAESQVMATSISNNMALDKP